MNTVPSLLLEVRNLRASFSTASGEFQAVKGIDFEIHRGEVVCLVGESGSGKTVTAFSIIGLLDANASVRADTLNFDGRDLRALPEKEMDRLRGKSISMIFQEPMTALNPSQKVASQIAEVYHIHERVSRRHAWEKAIKLMERVGIRDAAGRASAYPHELSGGMRQRIMIALACCMSPALIIADEPTTALDVTIQQQVLKLLFEIQAETGSAVLFITHDLGVVAEIADRVIVMQHGRIVEQGTVGDIFMSPKDPYTKALLGALPDVDSPRSPDRRFAMTHQEKMEKTE